MNLYAESSAVMAWLFEEETADAVQAAFAGASYVLVSDLTMIECARALIRAQVLGTLSEIEVSRRRALLEAAASRWTLLRLDGEILERARRQFPQEPVRALDSLHLASALAARAAVSELALLSLDQRVRENGKALGFDVLPL